MPIRNHVPSASRKMSPSQPATSAPISSGEAAGSTAKASAGISMTFVTIRARSGPNRTNVNCSKQSSACPPMRRRTSRSFTGGTLATYGLKMPSLPDPVLWAIPAFILLTVIEAISFVFHPDEDEQGYAAKDTATSLAMGLGSLFTGLLWKIPAVALFALVYELTPLRVELRS